MMIEWDRAHVFHAHTNYMDIEYSLQSSYSFPFAASHWQQPTAHVMSACVVCNNMCTHDVRVLVTYIFLFMMMITIIWRSFHHVLVTPWYAQKPRRHNSCWWWFFFFFLFHCFSHGLFTNSILWFVGIFATVLPEQLCVCARAWIP